MSDSRLLSEVRTNKHQQERCDATTAIFAVSLNAQWWLQEALLKRRDFCETHVDGGTARLSMVGFIHTARQSVTVDSVSMEFIAAFSAACRLKQLRTHRLRLSPDSASLQRLRHTCHALRTRPVHACVR